MRRFTERDHRDRCLQEIIPIVFNFDQHAGEPSLQSHSRFGKDVELVFTVSVCLLIIFVK